MALRYTYETQAPTHPCEKNYGKMEDQGLLLSEWITTKTFIKLLNFQKMMLEDLAIMKLNYSVLWMLSTTY